MFERGKCGACESRAYTTRQAGTVGVAALLWLCCSLGAWRLAAVLAQRPRREGERGYYVLYVHHVRAQPEPAERHERIVAHLHRRLVGPSGHHDMLLVGADGAAYRPPGDSRSLSSEPK